MLGVIGLMFMLESKVVSPLVYLKESWFRSGSGLRNAREPGGLLEGRVILVLEFFCFVSHVCVRCFVGIYVLLLCVVNCAILAAVCYQRLSHPISGRSPATSGVGWSR